MKDDPHGSFARVPRNKGIAVVSFASLVFLSLTQVIVRGSSASADYKIVHDSFTAGGNRSASSWYQMDDSLGVIGGVSRSMDGQIAIWLEHLGTFVANNAAPLPRDLSLERESDKGIRIAVAKLLQAAHDADGDVLALERFDAISSNGGSVQNVSDWLLYEPPLNNVSDSFTYTISDSEGAIGEGTIFITIWEDEQSPTQNMTSVVVQGDQVIVRFVGIPGVKYQIERTNSLSKPEWQAMHIAAAAPNGRFEVRDTRLEGQMRFYRAIVAPEE